MENYAGRRHWKYNQMVPVIDSKTGEILGKAKPSKIVRADMDNGNRPYINFKGENIACSCDTSKQDLKITLYKGEEIWLS